MIISHFPSGSGGGSGFPQFTYTGKYFIESDAGGWKIKLLSSGVLTCLSNTIVDIFAVGSGGSGYKYKVTTRQTMSNTGTEYYREVYGAGGGSGYTYTEKQYTLVAGRSYDVTIGIFGGASSIAYNGSDICIANGGSDSSSWFRSGDGGTGGATSGVYEYYANKNYKFGTKYIEPQTDGRDGKGTYPGEGQGTTTREFGDANGELYANGGGAYSSFATTPQMKDNTGDGGHGGPDATNGASGIIIIRNTRA